MPATASTEFVPAGFDASKWENIDPLLKALSERPVETREDLERWLVDRGEVEAAVNEVEANLYITMTCRTDDEAAQRAYAQFIETISPKLKPALFELGKRQIELTDRLSLNAPRFTVLTRDIRSSVELFRPENVSIQTELEKLSTEYQKIIGAMTVNFDGREQTLPQMGRYMESTDRAVREGAWRVIADRRARDADVIDGIFDRMIALRDRMARNAGLSTFVEYAFKAKNRFDYTPRECLAFHDAVEQAIVPLVRRLDEQRRRSLKVDELRPWDRAVDVKGREPLRPFEGGVDLIKKSRRTFDRLDRRLAGMFAELGDGSESRGADRGARLDLDSRKGKAPGGYQYMRDRSRIPFIFMNAAGLHRDVETMVHEAGHAFHSALCVDEPLLHYRSSPLEFAEVASMAMELLTMKHWGGADGFYPTEEDLARGQRRQLEDSITLLPWIATIDAFQLWLYTHPTHTRAQRIEQWLALDDRFGPAVSWRGLEQFRGIVWHRQSHLFGSPFYYIEYGIARLGSLQLWLRSLEEGEKVAVDAYVKALSLGGSRPLPDLFAAAGLTFDFGADMVTRLAERVERELEKLPE